MHYDVVIAGAGVAGGTLALCYARHGLRVLVADRKRDIDDYKKLCTHFIQPVALPIIRRLGLQEVLEQAGAVRTRAAFWTPAGWVDPPGTYGAGETASHAYNIERRILDPLLRRRLLAAPGLELALGSDVAAVTPTDGGFAVSLAGGNRPPITARLVVAADGRQSPLARHLGNDSTAEENQRAAYFGYFDRVAPPVHDRSLFLLGAAEMGFLYPLGNERALLSVYITKVEAADWAADPDRARRLVAFFDRFPDVPDLGRARSTSPIYGYRDYPNLRRAAVHRGVPFVGDAALSLDPMSGVGCAFAMVSAEMLAEATTEALRSGSDLADGLERYRAAFEQFFPPHARGIQADSIIAKSPETVASVYRRIVASPALQRTFIDLTGRLVTPSQFQRAFLLSGRPMAQETA